MNFLFIYYYAERILKATRYYFIHSLYGTFSPWVVTHRTTTWKYACVFAPANQESLSLRDASQSTQLLTPSFWILNQKPKYFHLIMWLTSMSNRYVLFQCYSSTNPHRLRYSVWLESQSLMPACLDIMQQYLHMDKQALEKHGRYKVEFIVLITKLII